MEIVAVIIGIVVAMAFGVFRKKQKSSGKTRIIVDHDSDDIEIKMDKNTDASKPSGFRKLLVLLVSVVAAVFVSLAIIVSVIEPEIGYVDPTKPLAIGMYLVFTIMFYAFIRAFSRK